MVPLLVDEPESDRAKALVENDPDVLVWWCTPVECASALRRYEREGKARVDDIDRARAALRVAMESWSEVTASEEVRDHALRLLRRHPIRSADALQLAAALTWARGRPNTHEFATLDDRLRDAARGEGFSVPL